MNKCKILDEIMMDCPICGESHKVELCEEKVKRTIKNDVVEYIEHYYRCNKYNTENIFYKDNMWSESLLNGIDAYRIKNDLLTSTEIKNIRKKYKLTQSELAFLIGVGEITITRYETKQIQEVSNDNILREVYNNAIFALNLLEKNKKKFNIKRYDEVSNNIKQIIDIETIKYLKEQEIIGKYINYSEENINNGNCILDINKLKSILAYIAKQMHTVKKVVLMKLLWYIDSYSFKLYGNAVTGLVYTHMTYGALPIAYDELLELSSLKYDIKVSNDGKYEYQISYNEEYKITGLTKKEKEIIDIVINKFRDYKSSDIAEYMHKEIAYKNTRENEIISFEFANKLNEF